MFQMPYANRTNPRIFRTYNIEFYAYYYIFSKNKRKQHIFMRLNDK